MNAPSAARPPWCEIVLSRPLRWKETRLPSRLRRPRRRHRGPASRPRHPPTSSSRRLRRPRRHRGPPRRTRLWRCGGPARRAARGRRRTRRPIRACTAARRSAARHDLSLDHAYDAVFDGADAYGAMRVRAARRRRHGGAELQRQESGNDFTAGARARARSRRARSPARQGRPPPQPQPDADAERPRQRGGGAAVAKAMRRPTWASSASTSRRTRALADARRRRRRRGGGGQWWQRAAQVRVVRATADAVVRAARRPWCRLLIWAQADRGAVSGGGGGGGGRPRRRRAAAGGRSEPDAVGRALRP